MRAAPSTTRWHPRSHCRPDRNPRADGSTGVPSLGRRAVQKGRDARQCPNPPRRRYLAVMASWSDNLDVAARAVRVRKLAHDGISVEQLAVDAGMWSHMVAARPSVGSSTKPASTWAARSTGSGRWPSNAIGCPGTPRAAGSGGPPGTGHRFRVGETTRRRSPLTCRRPREMDGEILLESTGTPEGFSSCSHDHHGDI